MNHPMLHPAVTPTVATTTNAASEPGSSNDAGSWSWYVRGTFADWDIDSPDPRLQRLAGTDFCLRLSAREAPRPDNNPDSNAQHHTAKHWHFHAGPLMRSSGSDLGWSAQVTTSGTQTLITLAGNDHELGPLALTLNFTHDDNNTNTADADTLGHFTQGALQHGQTAPSQLAVRRATARCLGASPSQ